MKLLVVIVNEKEKLEELLEGFVELGIPGATILDSVGMGQYLKEEVPVFAGFRFLFEESRPYNKTVLSVIPDEMEDKAFDLINKVLEGLSRPGVGIAFTVDLSRVEGLRKD